MKISKILLLFAIISLKNYASAQSINDTIFNNVVLIQQKDIVKNSGNKNYLIDVVLNFTETPIILNDTKLSTDFFVNQLLKHRPMILISPDWKFYDKIAEEAEQMGGCIEPATTNIIYQRKYIENKPKTDSIRISGGQPKLIFTQNIKDLKSSDNIIYYHTESFGSVCCPKDPKWKIIGKLDKYIESFEKTNNIKIGNVYKKITGKEGEHIRYFTLSNLSKNQKLNFLHEINFWQFKNPENKDIKIIPQIYTPKSIKKEGLILVTKQ